VTSRPVLAALAAVVVALGLAGCVSMPTGGPVRSDPVTQGPAAQNQPFVQVVPQPPGAGWSPIEIVQGFLTASASFGNYSNVAYQYLTPQLQQNWNPAWSATVYTSGPTPTGLTYQSSGTKTQDTATVQIAGDRQASLQGYGNYSVASSSSPGGALGPKPFFTLTKQNGQWRIKTAPSSLLLTSDSFHDDYQLRDLYFFDPSGKYLVPDPVYVPLRASASVINGMVADLNSPPGDWLAGGATKTAFPKGTKFSVTLNGVTAVVNLTGSAITKAAAQANSQVMKRISAQLLATLVVNAQTGSGGQGVQSVEVQLNGNPWTPSGSQDNPVQQNGAWQPASGKSPEFYYLDSQGFLTSRNGTTGKPVGLTRIGTGFSQIAVSPDGRYVAALRGSTLYTGPTDGTLTKRSGAFVAISWDDSDNLWASQGFQIVEFRASAGPGQPLGQMVAVTPLEQPDVSVTNPNQEFTQLRVAPDGVRVAIVMGGTELTFGAISGQDGPTPQITFSQVQLSPVNATEFTGLTWYGPDDVITLATPGPAVTEYSVSGGAATPIPAEEGMRTVTASSGEPLIADLPGGKLYANPNPQGSWIPLSGGGSASAYPG
jgi:hypothetical protein